MTSALLKTLSSTQLGAEADTPLVSHAIINSVECITARHLFEKTGDELRSVTGSSGTQTRCENMSQLTIELASVIEQMDHPVPWRLVLVFDGIDRQREAPYSLLPALARLSEIVRILLLVKRLFKDSSSYL